MARKLLSSRPRERPTVHLLHHGEGQGHNTPDCIVMRREFDRHYGDFHEYMQTRGTQPDAEGGAGRKVNIVSIRTKTTRVRVGVGVIRRSSRERHNHKDTDPGLAGMRTASPEDVATRATGLILRTGADGAGAGASGRCRRLICRLDNFPTRTNIGSSRT